DAIPLLESGLKIAAQRADLHAALGESYFMSGKAERAIEEFRTLIQLDPSPPSYAFMGLSYRHLGRFDEARRYFQEGLKKDPRNASCLFNMGYIEERQGNHARAEELFQQALRSNRDFSEALLELANLRIANKRLEEAAELLRRYVKVSRNAASGDYRTQTGVGVLLARYRLYDDAVQHFQSALRANPDSDDVRFDLTDAYFRKGLYTQALEAARQISAAGQQEDAYLALLGDIYAHLGDTARAKEIFQEAIRRNPDNDQ